MSKTISLAGILSVPVLLLALGSRMPAQAQAPTRTPTRTPTGLIFVLPKTPTPTLPVIVVPPSPTLPSSGPPTWTRAPTVTATSLVFTVPSATATTGNLVGELPPSATPHGDPYEPDFPLTLPSSTATVEFTIGPEVPDLSLTHIEITQGMQSLNNDMPLIAGRTTIARVYVRSHDSNWGNVTGVLQAWRDGQYLGMIDPENGPIAAYTTGGDRVNTDDTLNFLLPSYWKTTGTLSIRGFIYSVDPDAPFELEPFWVNNFREVEVEFQQGEGVRLSLWPIHLHLGYDGANPEVTYLTSDPTLGTVVAGLSRLLPVRAVYVYAAPVSQLYCIATTGGEAGVGLVGGPDIHGPCEFSLQSVGGAQYVNQVMAWVDFLTDDPAPGVINYGMVDPVYSPNMTFYNDTLIPLNYAGLALYGESHGIMDTTTWANTPWQMRGGETLAHEIGHRLGLGHVNCAGTEELGGGLDEDFPWTLADCKLALLHPSGYYGFDVMYASFPGMTAPIAISNDPAEAEPNHGYPLMGYQAPKWLDAYHYCKVLNNLGVPCDINVVPFLASEAGRAWLALAQESQANAAKELTRPSIPAKPARSDDGFLLVSGSVDRITGTASIQRAFQIPSLGSADQARLMDPRSVYGAMARPTDYTLVLAGAAGEILGEIPITDTSTAHGPVASIGFLAALVYDPQAVALQIRLGDAVLAERRVSAHAPQVHLLTPNGGETLQAPLEIAWEAEDPDGDRLEFVVQFSPDAGQTWQAIRVGVSSTLARLDDLDLLAGTAQGKFRVLASDGVLTAADESDGVFTTANTPPLALLVSPTHRSVYPLGASLVLSGSATDREDGILPGASLAWESDRDGPLGTGEEVTLRSLSPGYHLITLSAVDSQGATGQARVLVGVDSGVVMTHLDEAGMEAVAGVLSHHGAAGPGIPTEDRAAPPPWLPIAVAALLLAGGVGFVVLVLPLLRQMLRR